MEIPAEFSGRVCKTKKGWLSINPRIESEIQKSWPDSYLDVVFENLNGKIETITVIVFESTEDCLAFRLRYGDDYV